MRTVCCRCANNWSLLQWSHNCQPMIVESFFAIVMQSFLRSACQKAMLPMSSIKPGPEAHRFQTLEIKDLCTLNGLFHLPFQAFQVGRRDLILTSCVIMWLSMKCRLFFVHRLAENLCVTLQIEANLLVLFHLDNAK